MGQIVGAPIDGSLPSNVLHCRVPALGVDVLGVRLPDHSRDRPKQRACWDWLESAAASLRGRPSVIIGDLNTDPAYPAHHCGDRFARMVGAGWQHALPPTGASYWALKSGAPKRLDHGFLSPHLHVTSAEYVTAVGPHTLVGSGGLSDHAALVVDAERA